MSMKHVALMSGMAGALVPAAWLAFQAAFGNDPGVVHAVVHETRLDMVVLLLWPGSLLLLGDPGGTSLVLPMVAAASNVLLYAALGCLLWVGVTRSRILLVVTAIAVSAGWFGLLRI